MSLREHPSARINRGIASACETDRMFNGHGRYEWEVRCELADQIEQFGCLITPPTPACQEWIDDDTERRARQ